MYLTNNGRLLYNNYYNLLSLDMSGCGCWMMNFHKYVLNVGRVIDDGLIRFVSLAFISERNESSQHEQFDNMPHLSVNTHSPLL